MITLDDLAEHLESLNRRNGPQEADYNLFEANVRLLHATDHIQGKQFSSAIRAALGEALSTSTMQGLALCKPNGYAGCFEIIDRIYTEYRSPNPALSAWDDYFQSKEPARAVRNRKAYFADWFSERVRDRGHRSLLNLASGPGRDLAEAMAMLGDNPCEVTCVDQDERAITYATTLCQPWLDSIQFEQANALRYRPQRRFDLVWSAGLFDYLPDRLFVRLLTRMKSWVNSGGEVVVGNFSPTNPSRPYMELVMDWVLIHRTPEDLLRLATDAGFKSSALRVGSEPLGVNLFLHASIP